MKFAIEKFESLRVGWNRRPMTEKELHRLARRTRLRVKEMPLRVHGFYMQMQGVSFICVNSRLNARLRLKVAFHELAHHLLHNGKPHFYQIDPGMKEECEAEVFALCAIIPQKLLKKYTLAELHEHEGFTWEMLRQRREIFEKHGI